MGRLLASDGNILLSKPPVSHSSPFYIDPFGFLIDAISVSQHGIAALIFREILILIGQMTIRLIREHE
jgi:hypothetical protein